MQHNPNSSQGQWLRVNKSNRCPLCQKDHWCLINPIANLALCMRVESQRPKLLKSGETGWLHQLGQSTARYDPTPRTRKETPSINCRRLVEKWTRETQMAQLQSLADHLEVTILSLRLLSACYAREHHAWAFVMKDGYDNMVGIRLRNWNGDKWAVTGSHQGCFIPRSQPFATALVAEVPTDAAAGLDLGYYCVGRPSCSGGMNDLRTNFKRKAVARAVIVSDNDSPGTRGAETLATHLGIPTCIVVLPAKDLRQFKQLGGSRALLDDMIENALWHQPKAQ